MRQVSVQADIQPTGINFVGPWAGVPIAWTPAEQFDEHTYRADLKRCCKADIPGVYTGGTTGEFYALEFEEYATITRATIQECHGNSTPCMIGVTATATRGILRRAAFAVEHGADAVQLSLPFWIEPSDGEILQLFRDLSRVIGDVPFSIYDTPRAKRTIDVDLHRAIKDTSPGYSMVKSVGGTVGATAHGCQALSRIIQVFVSETIWGTLGSYGAAGSCSAMVYWNPKLTLGLWNMVSIRDWKTLSSELAIVQAFHRFLFEQFGKRGFTDGAYDRVVSNATGFLKVGLTCRSPYSSPSSADVEIVRDWLKRNYSDMMAH